MRSHGLRRTRAHACARKGEYLIRARDAAQVSDSDFGIQRERVTAEREVKVDQERKPPDLLCAMAPVCSAAVLRASPTPSSARTVRIRFALSS